jgi:hypothetical protein
MRRKKIDKQHREYRTKRRKIVDICRYLLQGPAFERLNPEE